MTYGDATYLEQSVKTAVKRRRDGPISVTTIDFILSDIRFEPVPDAPGKTSMHTLYVPKNADQPSLYDFEIREKERSNMEIVWRAFATRVACEYLRQKHPWAAALPDVKSYSYAWNGDTFLFTFRAVAELREDATRCSKTLS